MALDNDQKQTPGKHLFREMDILSTGTIASPVAQPALESAIDLSMLSNADFAGNSEIDADFMMEPRSTKVKRTRAG